MESYWDLLSPDLQSFILQISKLNHIREKKKKFVEYLNEILITSYKFNICYGLYFIHPKKYLFSISYVKNHINLILQILLLSQYYSMNQLIYLTEHELKNLLINSKYYNVISFWRYYYFMKQYNENININDLEIRWLQKINILK